MGRIRNTFTALRNSEDTALIAYITAGDPNLNQTKNIILGLESAGVDILELGVPFSDPTADGPIIQAASQRALRSGTTISHILEMIESVRKFSEIPIVLFGYYNPIFIYGTGNFAKRATAAGVDGILVVDLPPEESQELREYTDRSGLDFISLIAPTTTTQRMKMISKTATGFLYYVSITGVTGTEKPLLTDIQREMKRIRTVTGMPVAVGFGISTREQAAEIAPYTDGIVIGSALVRLIEENRDRKNLVNIVSSYAKDIKTAIREDGTGITHREA